MKLLADHDYQTLPEPIHEPTAELIIYPRGNSEKIPDSYGIRARPMSFQEMVEMKSKFPEQARISGVPSAWAIGRVEGVQRIFFWPTPAQDMFARFRFCSPMKEI